MSVMNLLTVVLHAGSALGVLVFAFLTGIEYASDSHFSIM